MDRDELHHHIESARPFGGADSRRLASLIVGACWPGGPEDRTEPGAFVWLRRWHPERIAAELPACSCDAGHCILCN
jgi:hypothetical protein